MLRTGASPNDVIRHCTIPTSNNNNNNNKNNNNNNNNNYYYYYFLQVVADLDVFFVFQQWSLHDIP